MNLMEEVWPRDKRPRPENLLANRVKALASLLSKRARLFLLFNLLYGVVFLRILRTFSAFLSSKSIIHISP